MVGTKRAALSKSSSPEAGSNKRARIDHDDEAKAQNGQEEQFEDAQETAPRKDHEEGRDNEELRIKEELGVEEEAGKEEDPGLQATHVINQLEPDVIARNSGDPSSGFPQEGNDENLPQIHLKLQEAREKDKRSTLEDGVVIDRLTSTFPTPKSHDQATNPSSNLYANKRARLELMVEIETEEELTLYDETEVATTAIASDNVADDLSDDPRSPDQTVQETMK
ncbi:hypothetical protein N0V85_008922 [Neurospora sp. IMI 360204]|nr:hypothetical protein N0V85_008922 [Neurospora sp. IMI 360204]